MLKIENPHFILFSDIKFEFTIINKNTLSPNVKVLKSLINVNIPNNVSKYNDCEELYSI